MLFGVIGKDFCCKCGCLGRHTLDAIVSIFAWSMQILWSGTWPTCRHDGTPFDKSDTYRKAKTGPLGFQSLLVQSRGDWAWLKEMFGFPSWASNQICWLCEADKSRKPFTDFGLSAAWRRSRRTPASFFRHQELQGISKSPLFNCPGFLLSMVVIDMLHACDLGVAQIALGNLFFEIMPSLGRNRTVQVKELWGKIRAYYEWSKPSTRLQGLTLEMIKRPGKKPKLKLKGGNARAHCFCCRAQSRAP